MVQTGVYRGYPQEGTKLLAEIPQTAFHIYDDPNNPGYTLMKNGDGWNPPDSPYIHMFRSLEWRSSGDDYSTWHYFWYGGSFSINYINTTKYVIWISGNPMYPSPGYANDAIFLYCQETDVLDYAPGTNCIYPAQKLTRMFREGINSIIWFGYSGPKFDPFGRTFYNYINPQGDIVGPAYIIRVKE